MDPKSDLYEKIDVAELIKDFAVFNADAFQTYLTGVWKDLASRSDNRYKGINKITFAKYYGLPGIIFDRLFSVINSSRTEYVSLDEFITGMMTLFTKDFDSLVRFIFQFYDFDKDGKICKEDLRIVLSYIPLSKKKLQRKDSSTSEYSDRIESQEELHSKLDAIFDKEATLNEEGFIQMVENVNSDIFLYILIFLMEQRPFNSETIKLLESIKKSPSVLNMPKSPGSKMIVSPTLNSIFEPSVTINNSPSMNKSPVQPSKTNEEEGIQKNIENNQDQSGYLMKLAGKMNVTMKMKPKPATKFKPNVFIKGNDFQRTPCRKPRGSLQDLDNNKTEQKYEGNDDIPLQPAIKFDTNKKSNLTGGIEDDKSVSSDESEPIFNQQNESEEMLQPNCSGYIYKPTHHKKVKKAWFKLIYKDLYYYKSAEDSLHKGMYNLSGIFAKEEPECMIDGKHFFCFSLINPMKSRKFYVEDEKEYFSWLLNLRIAVGYADLKAVYEIKGKLGSGKFGLVCLGINKLTKEKVAIKIMNKHKMSTIDLEQVKTEIEILKVANHPNIIALYDVFENIEYIYISKLSTILTDVVMEYCSGGDLFSYLEKRKFVLSEERTAVIIHKLATALFFLHEYGIIHRDLKPENILMTDESDDADIKLLDFGLGKMLGPNETCTESFGTLSYVSPEVIQEKPYDKSVDLWAIGVIAYLLVSGFLPFDDEHSEKEIARQTVYDPVHYPPAIWSKISPEAKQFIDNLLNKCPEKRMKIKEVLEHPWMQKFYSSPSLHSDSRLMTGGAVFKMYSNPEQKKAPCSSR